MSATTIARAWMVRRADGLCLGFTDHDRALRFGGVEFAPEYGMTARVLVQGTGLSVDNSEAVGALSADAISERDILAGRWDGAELKLWDVDWRDVAQRRLVFAGSLAEVSRANGAFRAELRGLAEPLNAARGRVFHPRCSARLGDGKCRFALVGEDYRAEIAVEEVEDGRVFRFASFPAYEQGWFERGVMSVLDGGAEGLSAAVKNDRALPGGQREIELWQSFGIAPVVGDVVAITAGCDKRAATCRLKFNNFMNFRGFPHLPNEDWLMAPGAGRNG
ncbi:DUF2163 domain-containing protein [Paracoccus caeni]|uniref:DUF2163 domain-containing protein n=1 Tax=Paracoccus caeni TaxID=657651 RepID=A0A934SHQ3_9RHOB|nr:DUF2163 domain-containing protein [Paracoccus caeni]MBK4217853.1 DUF2163 domain-containing protein [Paracoccus caeni]